jgi:hypothetical protein
MKLWLITVVPFVFRAIFVVSGIWVYLWLAWDIASYLNFLSWYVRFPLLLLVFVGLGFLWSLCMYPLSLLERRVLSLLGLSQTDIDALLDPNDKKKR